MENHAVTLQEFTGPHPLCLKSLTIFLTQAGLKPHGTICAPLKYAQPPVFWPAKTAQVPNPGIWEVDQWMLAFVHFTKNLPYP